MWATCRSERNWCWACARSILGEHELNGWLRLANITPPLEYGANPKRPRQRVRPWQMNQLRWFTEWKGGFGGCRGRGTCVVGVCVCERGIFFLWISMLFSQIYDLVIYFVYSFINLS